MKLLDLLPESYKKSAETVDFENAFEPELENLQADGEDVRRQMNVSTATWGLTLWESAYGLQTDTQKSEAERRSRINAKMRGQGTTTKTMVENVAQSFTDGTATVIEQPQDFKFEIKFSQLGEPKFLAELTAALEEIKPAHLVFAYIIRFRTYAELKNKTHAQLRSYTHKILRAGEIN